jgi:IS5 family transposase
LLLNATVLAGVKTKTVNKRSFKDVVIDSTVMDKAITHPTDAKLFHRCRVHLVKLAKHHNVPLRQSYARLSRLQHLMVGRYAKAKQFRRMRKATKKLKTYLGRVTRDIERKSADNDELETVFQPKLNQARQLLTQQRKSKNKLYSLHAPEVECIGKGKAHKPWEFGVKVSVVTTVKEQFVLASHALPGNPYDGHTLWHGLTQAMHATGVLADNAYVDRGYRGHLKGPTTVYIAGQKRGVSEHRKRQLKRRNAIEAIIGHMKTDGWLGRNHLLGKIGDAMNALLCGAGQNLRMILKKLRFLLRCLLVWLEHSVPLPQPQRR